MIIGCMAAFQRKIILPERTQRIERTNSTHRTRIKRLNRKTIGYSESEEMHNKVIGTFIEREHYFQCSI
ncbi:hypothetical protein XBO1_2090001 [Xenorhabdus bovienii str. oregonense]|uniref:Insertion element iso-IS1n protein insB n=1 Tax=Xenorhabdus bovienii str. oregonense TaxID=1398202 RepID=A0A077NUN1_XENBV|nr:hypothetical protein XBO1_2090001 [Xenorhabdus bovienii str. oregonense]